MKTSLLVCSSLAALVVACTSCSRTPPAPLADTATDPARPAAPAAAPPAATALDPCALLAMSDVRKVLADAKAGVRDRGDERQGVMLCSWSGEDGRISLQLHDAPPNAAAREIQERALGLIDLKNADAVSAVRVEVVPGVGDATLAVAEDVDPARGIRRAGAIVVTQKGYRVVTISAEPLAAGDRASALAKLGELARAAATKL